MQTKRFSTTETIMGLIFMAAIVWFIFFLFKSIYSILALAAPFLIIAAMVINRKVVLSYGKMVLGLLQKNTITGVLAVLLTIFAFPFVAAILLALAIMNKKADTIIEGERLKRDGIPTDFRELSSAPKKEYDELFKK